MKEKVIAKFKELFGDKGEIQSYFAPGRVNLIGEHTDYNGGHVFPCALTIGTYAAARKRDDRVLRFYSVNFEKLGVLESTIDDLIYKKEEDWINYPKGVIWALKEDGYTIDSGFDIVYFGNIPNGSGLSSSASLEVLTGFVLKDLFNLEIDMVKLSLICQKAENKYVGVNCGIMDQFIIANGEKDSAVFLDTATLKYEYAPCILKDEKIVIINSNKKRGLNESKYNERRAECDKALEELQVKLNIKTLGDLTEKEFEENKYFIKDEVRRKRAKHAVYENRRTIKAVEALKEKNIGLLGKLMIESHNSLRDDYEVTGLHLDTLVEETLKQDGVIGARMTGAGFGGCAVSIVKNDKVNSLIENVSKTYEEKTGIKPEFYVVEIGEGPVIL